MGYGVPHYLDVNYPFAANPPNIPNEYNPVGSYRKSFELPANWVDNDVIIQFGAVRSAFYIWINGKKVGYSQGSKLPAEFNITSFVQPGENLIAIEVYRWSDGSYLEDQDMWRLSGIDRSVIIYNRPKTHIADHFVKLIWTKIIRMAYWTSRFQLGGNLSQEGDLFISLLEGTKSIMELKTPFSSHKMVF